MRSWKPAVALMVVGVLLGLPLVVSAVRTVGSTVTARPHTTPIVLTESIDRGRYVIFERTGTTRRAGPFTQQSSSAPTLSPESVHVTGPDGTELPVRYDEASETITQGNAVFVGVLVFDVASAGEHEVAVGGEGRQVLVSRSLGESFRSLGRPFLLAVVGGITFLAGLLGLVIGSIRRARSSAVPAAVGWTGPPAAGWYPEPSGAGGQRYWDGSSWTDHVAP